jgi:prepilin-type N-terminal cleavage/methylation domain-containing protein
MSPSRTGKDGFTLIELMVAVAITALIGLVVWQGAVQAQRTTDMMSVHSRTTMRILQMERSLRKQTSHILMPYWIGNLESFVDLDAGEMEIPFYEGEADSYLVVNHSDDMLLIGTRGGKTGEMSNVQQFDGISEILFDVIENDAGELLGIQYQVYVTRKNDQPVVIMAGFGSNPFWFTTR